MNVIDFPRRDERLPPSPPAAEQLELGDTLEAASDIHRMIINAMLMGRLRESPGALRSVLLFAMEQHFGPELVIWAEQQFEAVYQPVDEVFWF